MSLPMQAEAPRLRKPGWKDPRLIIGILLIALSVVAVVSLVQSADQRQVYWSAGSDLTPGVALNAEDLVETEANLGDRSDFYLSVNDELPETFVVRATVLQGEFVAASHIAETDPLNRQQVALQLSDPLSESITTGSRADVWVAEVGENGRGFEQPALLSERAEVVGVQSSSGAFGGAGVATVYVLISQDQLPRILGAQGNGARISLVPSVSGAK